MKFFPGIILVLAVVSPAWAAPVVPAAVQSTIRQRVDLGYNAGIVAGMADAGGRAYFSYGSGSLATNQVLHERSLFEIGSVTKVFTGTLLARLIQLGEAALTNRLRDYMPAGRSAPAWGAQEINLGHLATQSSGLPYLPGNMAGGAYIDNPFADYTVEKLYEFLGSYALPRAPGAAYEYSNVGVGLLGHALAWRAGASYEDLLRARLLDPLGLNDTRIHLSPEQAGRRATGYGGVWERPPFEMASLEGAGALYSSAADLLRFLEFAAGLRATEMAPAFLDARTLRRATDIPGLNIGLTWWLLPYDGDLIVLHEGNTIGFTAFIGYRVATKTAAVVLTNARVNEFSNLEDIGLNLLGVPVSLTTIPAPAAVPLDLMRKYQGLYTATDGTFFDLRLTNRFLNFAFSNASNYFTTLYPQSPARMDVVEPGVSAFAVFNTNGAGRVTGLMWNQDGQALNYTRERTPARLSVSMDGTMSLFGDAQESYALQRTSDFNEWRSFSTNTIWTNRVAWPGATGGRDFFRAALRE